MSWTYKALRATKPASFAAPTPGSKETKPTLLPNAQMQLHSRVVRAVSLGDIAQLYTDFEGTTVDSFSKTVPVYNKAIEVLRQQPKGNWKLTMGDPNARE